MRYTMYIFIFVYLGILWADTTPRYAITLVSVVPEKSQENDKWLSQEDRRAAYGIAMKYLKKYCRFFDEELYSSRIDEMYRKNPDLDPTDIQNKLAALSLPTKLIVVLETEVKTLEELPFQKVRRHQAEVSIKVVDKSGWSEIYAQAKGKTPKLILLPPLQGSTIHHWHVNRRSRNRAIEEAIEPLIPELINQLKKNQSIIDAFDFLAIRLYGEKKIAMWQLLEDINVFSDNGIKIDDKKYTTDQGIAAKVFCKSGIAVFMQELTRKLSVHPTLKDMLCDTDGTMVKVYPEEKEPEILASNQKFDGRLILSRDITKIKETKLEETIHYEWNQQTLKSYLWENMQTNFRVFDASELWENLKQENIRLQSYAATHPTDYLAKKNNAATHTVYFWGKTKFKNEGSQKYCFAELGIRIVRMVTAETVAYYNLTSEEEFKRGVMVTRDEKNASREALNLLVKRALTKIVSRLNVEENFEVFQPKIIISADNFETKSINTLKNIISDMEKEGKIIVKNGLQSGESFLRGEISFPEGETKISQSGLRQILIEYSEAEELLIYVQSDIGKMYITPQKYRED